MVLGGAEKVVKQAASAIEEEVKAAQKELDEPAKGASTRGRDPASLIMKMWGPVEGPKALAVARCESNLRVNARSAAGYEGIFQLGPWERTAYGAFNDARSQVEAAYRLFRARGWHPWPNCARAFLNP
ncbi:MAG: transglycosylase family protein [Actinomycetota bacterium]|nr:transglycosylase family protein [Actinomycetota bacterium]